MLIFVVYDVIYSSSRRLKRWVFKQEYKAVVFDMGGVYLQYKDPKYIDSILKTSGPEFRKALHDYEVGDASLEHLVQALNKNRVVQKDPKEAVSSILAGKDPHIISAIEKIREHGSYRTALLSNVGYSDPSFTQTDVREVDPAHFDVIVESCRVKLRKPDKRIFLLTAEKIGVKPEECIFVDDLWANCRAAELVGMTTVEVVLGDTQSAVKKIEALLGKPLT